MPWVNAPLIQDPESDTFDPAKYMPASEARRKYEPELWPFLVEFIDRHLYHKTDANSLTELEMQIMPVHVLTRVRFGIPLPLDRDDGKMVVSPELEHGITYRDVDLATADCFAILLGDGQELPDDVPQGMHVIRAYGHQTQEYTVIDFRIKMETALVRELDVKIDQEGLDEFRKAEAADFRRAQEFLIKRFGGHALGDSCDTAMPSTAEGGSEAPDM